MWLFYPLLSWYQQKRLRMRHPSCSFRGNVAVESSQLGRFLTLFDNVYISASRIGDFTYVQKNAAVIKADVGSFCSIAGGARIGLGSHPLDRVSTHPAFYSACQPLAKTFSRQERFESFRRTTLGHDVWVGENSLIKDGVNIGTGAVIGAGAVVTSDVPAYAVVTGVPARVIKYRFAPDVREFLLRSAWWEKPVEWFESNCDAFRSIEAFRQCCNNNKGG